MQGYAERTFFSQHTIEAYHLAVRLVASLPTPKYGVELRCHELAVALAHVLPCVPDTNLDWKVVHGLRGPVQHSWLAAYIFSDVRPGLVGNVLLDPYVPGSMPMVQLVDTFACPKLYVTDTFGRTDINLDAVTNLVALFKLEMGHTARRYPFAATGI